MGITIAYRGRLADPTRIEDFEDRVLDFALEVGGLAQIWRSHPDGRPERMIRGVILHLAPGQETTSLLVAPEGWFIGLVEIADAERGALAEPPWCFTKTQFGPLEGHVALVEMFKALKREFVPDLEVSDEGGYWETGDLTELARRRDLIDSAMARLAEGLQRHGLSREAAEDPDILCRRIERIAAQVHRILGRPAEHPPVSFPDESESGGVPDVDETEARWDELFKHNRRQQERLQRAIEERRSSGQDDETAFEDAMGDLGLEDPGEEDEAYDGSREESFAAPDEIGFQEKEEDTSPAEEDERQPLLERAMDLLKRLRDVFRDVEGGFEAPLHTLFQGAGDAMGGLAQALSSRADDPDAYGLCVVQIKRALRGAAFARGALFLLRPAVPGEPLDELHRTLAQLEKDIFQELSRLRSQHAAEDP
jgi:hypothetical protein